MVVVDLTTAPASPSILERGATHERGDSDFLLGLITDVSKPIEKANRIHIEYAPTQVVAEYIRHKLMLDGRHIDGIMYSSSRGDGNNFVFFVDSRYIEGSGSSLPKEPKFRLVRAEDRHVPPRK
jgi:hypothetical protein